MYKYKNYKTLIDTRHITCKKGITQEHTKQNLLNEIEKAKHNNKDYKGSKDFDYSEKEFRQVVLKIHQGKSRSLEIVRVISVW